MKFLCPTCQTPLPAAAVAAVVPCTQCGVSVDLTRVETSPGSSALSPEVDLSGETLGGFRLGARLGAGGMGAVYDAEGPPGRCAVKVLATALGAEPSLRQRFRREAAALEAVKHPGVVRVFSEGEERGFCWYAMERIDGPDLRARLKEGPLSRRDVDRLARDMLSALDAVHAKGLVHRDIKPGNILLSNDGAKLCDFGIARFDGSTTLTESAALMGSLRYMSPEQRRGHADAQSDLYALGLVLHEASAGGLPDEAPLTNASPRAKRLIHALLRDKAKERPANARAAAALLETSVLRARPALTAGVGLAAVAVAAVGGNQWLRTRPPIAPAVAPPIAKETAGPQFPVQAMTSTPTDQGELPRNPLVKQAVQEPTKEPPPQQVFQNAVDYSGKEASTAGGIDSLQVKRTRAKPKAAPQKISKVQSSNGLEGLGTKARLEKMKKMKSAEALEEAQAKDEPAAEPANGDSPQAQQAQVAAPPPTANTKARPQSIKGSSFDFESTSGSANAPQQQVAPAQYPQQSYRK